MTKVEQTWREKWLAKEENDSNNNSSNDEGIDEKL
jgi:hypothetical protein